MRDIEEWGSGFRRVNRVLAEYGIRPVAIDEAAFATQMNVYLIAAPGMREMREVVREMREMSNSLFLQRLRLILRLLLQGLERNLACLMRP